MLSCSEDFLCKLSFISTLSRVMSAHHLQFYVDEAFHYKFLKKEVRKATLGKQDAIGGGFVRKNEFTSIYNSFLFFSLCSIMNELIFKPVDFLYRIDNDGDVDLSKKYQHGNGNFKL